LGLSIGSVGSGLVNMPVKPEHKMLATLSSNVSLYPGRFLLFSGRVARGLRGFVHVPVRSHVLCIKLLLELVYSKLHNCPVNP
jgi:hypothetical protein